MNSPESYLGKTIKMNGNHYSYFSEETKKTYYFVMIEDATACCIQGLEIIWKGEHSYPGDYPQENSIVVVEGVFKKYLEVEYKYYYVETEDINLL